jgi:hypothetical protein
MTQVLGRLARVPLREAWRNEASHFTPWLALPENLGLLSETMGLASDGLEIQGQEQAVGPFRADLLCRNIEDDSLVLIENQLERTDHSHLGQLLTYAAGLEAVTLVWIAERFTEEHRAALDWLNEVTDEGVDIFGFEIELWRIGESPFAPKFNVVVKPNTWARTAKRAGRGGPSAAASDMQVAYWTSFATYLSSVRSDLKPPKPSPSNWMAWGVGRSGVHLLARVNQNSLVVGIEVNTREHPTWFQQLFQRREAVEQALGVPLDWEEKPTNKYSSALFRREIDVRDEENWPTAHSWMAERLSALRRTFRPLVKALDGGLPDELGLP